MLAVLLFRKFLIGELKMRQYETYRCDKCGAEVEFKTWAAARLAAAASR